jgi:hypothetical protein
MLSPAVTKWVQVASATFIQTRPALSKFIEDPTSPTQKPSIESCAESIKFSLTQSAVLPSNCSPSN